MPEIKSEENGVGVEHDIEKFSAQEPSRYSITNVAFHMREKFVSATDGHVAIRVPFRGVEGPMGEVNGQPIVMSKTKWKRLMSFIRSTPLAYQTKCVRGRSRRVYEKGRKVDCDFVTQEDGRAKITAHGCDASDTDKIELSTMVAGSLDTKRYPNVSEVIAEERAKPMTFHVKFSLATLGLIIDHARKYGDLGQATSIAFSFTGASNGAIFSYRLKTGQTVDGIVMPIIQP